MERNKGFMERKKDFMERKLGFLENGVHIRREYAPYLLRRCSTWITVLTFK